MYANIIQAVILNVPLLLRVDLRFARFLLALLKVAAVVENKQLTLRYKHMAHDPGNISTLGIYHLLDDGRVVESKMGKPFDSDGAIWARNLSDSEKQTYLKLKGQGRSDRDIYNYFNPKNKKKVVCGR